MRPEAYLDPEVVSRLARLDLVARFVMEGFLAGLHRSPFKGFSVEFSAHRRYVPGDAPRMIDWKVYARTRRHYVKEFQAETNLEAHLVVDTSGSMDYAGARARGLTKHRYGICLAATLAYLMVRQRDPVGLFTFDTRLAHAAEPHSTRGHLTRILTRLDGTRPAGTSNVGACLHEVAERLAKRSLVVVISDLMDGEDRVREALAHLAFRGHEVVIFHLLSADERRFDVRGASRLMDLETGERVDVDAAGLRPRYLAELGAWQERLARECRRRRIDYVPLDTGMRFDAALMAYLARRAGG